MPCQKKGRLLCLQDCLIVLEGGDIMSDFEMLSIMLLFDSVIMAILLECIKK